MKKELWSTQVSPCVGEWDWLESVREGVPVKWEVFVLRRNDRGRVALWGHFFTAEPERLNEALESECPQSPEASWIAVVPVPAGHGDLSEAKYQAKVARAEERSSLPLGERVKHSSRLYVVGLYDPKWGRAAVHVVHSTTQRQAVKVAKTHWLGDAFNNASLPHRTAVLPWKHGDPVPDFVVRDEMWSGPEHWGHECLHAVADLTANANCFPPPQRDMYLLEAQGLLEEYQAHWAPLACAQWAERHGP